MPDSYKSAPAMLAESLKTRYFHDSTEFRNRYGETTHEKFGAMIPIVENFLKWLEVYNELRLYDVDKIVNDRREKRALWIKEEANESASEE